MFAKYPASLRKGRRQFMKKMGAGTGAALLLPALPASPQESAGFPSLAERQAAHRKKGMIPANKTYRMMEWEFHSPPNANFNIDVEGALRAAREAGAESVMFYTQDHWGYCFYQSKVAVRNPSLNYDLFGKEVSTARDLGITAVAYFSLQFNNQIVLSHPDWGWVNEKGEQQRLRWYVPCLDSPYRQYVLGMMEEIFSGYEVGELFLDIFGIQFALYHGEGRDPFCFCKYTEEAWDKEHPGDPYRQGFKTREGWERRYEWHKKRTMVQMLDEVMAIARKHRPNVLISLNGGPESFPDEVMQKVSFIYAEPITTETGISVGSILMRGWGRPDYQAGVFSRQGYLDLYPGSIPRVLADGLVEQNARTFFVGNAPVIGGLDGQGFSKRWFQVAKEQWEDVRNVDCLLEGIEPLYSTATLYSVSTREELAAQKRPTDFRRSNVGALETLTYAGRPIESIAELRLSRDLLAQFEALVLPEVLVLSNAHTELIRQWVGNGGTLIATGKCGLLDENRQERSNFPLADVFGVDYVSEETKYAYDQSGKLKEGVTSIYLESAGHRLAKLLATSTVGLPGPYLNLKRTTAMEVMRYRLPYMVEDLPHNKWFNWGPPPPGSETGGIAVAYNQYGKGQAVYVGVDLFRAMAHRPFWIRRWVPDLMKQLVPRPVAELAADPSSEYVHGTFFWDKSRKFILVQVLNAVELATQGEFRPVPRVVIRLSPQKVRVTAARIVWPKEQNLPIETGAESTRLVIPSPPRYAALYLKLA
ncbi:MAG TPA: hypothetical protein VFD30_08125 [Terriglobia bacterium]|jgi:hypothetical protein|nr:hypothetical protein [Terriglobia bacterium]